MKTFEGKSHYPLNLDQVPLAWRTAFVGDVCQEVQSGFASGEHNAEGSGVPHLRPMNIDRLGRLDLTQIKSVDPSIDARRLSVGDVLFNNTNSPVLVGKTAAIRHKADLAFSNHMTRLRPAADVDAEYLAHHLHYLWMGAYFLHRCSKHVNQASVSSETLARTVPIAVAPIREQKRIVEALDSYLSRLDSAVASLQKVQTKLKAYRASVLKAAVEGRLVPTEAEIARREGRDYEPASVLLARILKERRRRWEEAELTRMKKAGKTPKDDAWKKKYEEPETPDTSKLPSLPEGWCWASLDALLAESLRNGHSARETKDLNGVRTLTLSAVTEADFGIHNTKPTVADRDKVDDLWLMAGDILIERANTPELVGTAAMFRGAPNFAIFPDLLVRVRCTRDVVGDYIEMVLRAPSSRRYFQTAAQGIAGSMPKISQGTIEMLPIPLPPASEQERIFVDVHRLLSIAESSGISVTRDLGRVHRLRQSILKWAFEGKLVDQDPNDEPAEDLLARIRAEREAAPTTKTRGRKAKSS